MAVSVPVPEGGGLVSKNGERNGPELVGLLGIGLDSKDEHHRITRGEQFLLVGGSEETHERMQDTASRFQEALQKRGKRLQDTSAEEAADLLRQAMES
jgi:hypothetical protein